MFLNESVDRLTGHMGHEATKPRLATLSIMVSKRRWVFQSPADHKKKNVTTGFLGWFFGGVFGVKMGGPFFGGGVVSTAFLGGLDYQLDFCLIKKTFGGDDSLAHRFLDGRVASTDTPEK